MVDPSFQLLAAAAGPGADQEMSRLLQLVLSWAYVACPVIAAVLCFAYRQVSPRLMVLGFGFVIHALILLAHRLVPYLVEGDHESVMRMFALLNIAGLGAWSLILVGLFLVLSDLRKRDDAPLTMTQPRPRREQPDEDRDRTEPLRIRREGSNDIQA